MLTTAPIDGFRLADDRLGDSRGGGQAVVLLHGWPGDRTDYRELAGLLADTFDVIVPDLRGFGASDKHRVDPAEGYSAVAHARSVVGLVDELDLRRPVIAGYDIGSRIAQAVARDHPDVVGSLMVSPPLPGIGDRILGPPSQPEFWYQGFQRLPLSDELIDGNRDAVRNYLRHFWNHWSGPDFTVSADDLEQLVDNYCVPGAFTSSVAWYRAGAGAIAVSLAEIPPAPEDRIVTPTTVLWPEHDPLFPGPGPTVSRSSSWT
ncbi:pimeloyl-ACP methyl ester carboxylesterase [Nakamurella sp. UYEF19]